MKHKDEYAIARSAWNGHQYNCKNCQHYVEGETGTLGFLCQRGTELFIRQYEIRKKLDGYERRKSR